MTSQSEEFDQNPMSQNGVETIMAERVNNSVSMDNVDTEAVSTQSSQSSKKRFLSEHESDIEIDQDDRVAKKHKTQGKHDGDDENMHVDNKTVFNMFRTLSDQVQNLYTDLSKRITSVEENLEMKLTQKLKCALDSRFESELSTVRSEIKDQLTVIRKEVDTKVGDLKKSYATVTKHGNGSDENLRQKRFVVKNLAEQKGENNDNRLLVYNVNALLKDGLKIANVKVEKAERKASNGPKPGCVIVTVDSNENKQSVMKNKRRLKDSRKYKDVYIENDMTVEMRKQSANMRTLLKELNCDRNLRVVDGRLMPVQRGRDDRHGGQSRDAGHRAGRGPRGERGR